MGSTPSATRTLTRDDLKQEGGYGDLEHFDEEKSKQICLNNAAGLGIDRRQLEEMLERRAIHATLDFCKERSYCFPLRKDLGNNEDRKADTGSFQCYTLYGLYSGFKFQSRKVCQDRVLMKEIHLANKRTYLMLGIFDGHGMSGEHCSGFVVNNIWKHVEFFLNKWPDDMQKALIKAFARTDKLLKTFSRANPECDVNLSGTTATVVLIDSDCSKGRKIHVAHVGDSKAIISTSNLEKRSQSGVLDLVIEHNFADPYESQRAIQKGGVVDRIVLNGQPQGPLRVFHKQNRVRPGLAVSRSFGDGEAHRVGVSSDPDLLHLHLLEHEDVIILASDGIWDFLSGRMILDRLDTKGWSVKTFESIIQECARRWIFSRTGVCDDLSIVIFRFNFDIRQPQPIPAVVSAAPLPDKETQQKLYEEQKPPNGPGGDDLPEEKMEVFLNREVTIAMEFNKSDVQAFSQEEKDKDIPRPNEDDEPEFELDMKQDDVLPDSAGKPTAEMLLKRASIRRSTLTSSADVDLEEHGKNLPRALPDDEKYTFAEGSVMDGDSSVNSQASDLAENNIVPSMILSEATNSEVRDVSKEVL